MDRSKTPTTQGVHQSKTDRESTKVLDAEKGKICGHFAPQGTYSEANFCVDHKACNGITGNKIVYPCPTTISIR